MTYIAETLRDQFDDPDTRSDDAPFVKGVLIVGAGYAGMAAARAVERAGVRATIVDSQAQHDFTTRLAAVAGGTASTTSASTDLTPHGYSVIEATVSAVRDGAVQLSDGTWLGADAVVVTVGSEPSRPPIDGLEHAFVLRAADHALALRAAIVDAPALIVIGGGASGVQLAGAAATAKPHLSITLLEQADRVVPGMSERTGANVHRILAERGVNIFTGTAVDRIEEHGVELSDGAHLDGVVVWAAGFEAHAGAYGTTLTDDGQMVLAPDMRVIGTQRTFAAGDIAAHIDDDGAALPMSAQIAEQAGHHAGVNAARLIKGQPLRDGHLTHRGWVLDLGGGRGVAEFGPLVLADPPFDRLPPLIHWLIDMKHAFTVAGFGAWSIRPT